MNETLKTIYSRRAVRKYKASPVDYAMIHQIIDAGKMAPSAMNKQPCRFYILTEEDQIHLFSKQIARAAIREIAKGGIKSIVKTIADLIHAPIGFKHIEESDFVFYHAPVVIFITAPRENEWASLDVGMCCQNMMLAAKSLGLDTCPVGFGKFVAHTSSYASLGIPAGETVLISLIIGYGNDQPEVHERKKGDIFFINAKV